VPEDVAQVVAEVLADLPGDTGRAGAERALEVGVLDQGQRGRRRAEDVVPLGVDGQGEGGRKTRGRSRRAAPRRAGTRSSPPRGQDEGEQHPDGRLVLELRGVERQADDEQRDCEPDARQGAAAQDLAWTDSLRQPPEPQGHPAEGTAADPHELAHHQADDHTPGDGEASASPQHALRAGRRRRWPLRRAARSRSSPRGGARSACARSPTPPGPGPCSPSGRPRAWVTAGRPGRAGRHPRPPPTGERRPGSAGRRPCRRSRRAA
jgi:hypothetical protein